MRADSGAARGRAELLPADDPRWAAFLAGTRHDFYHRPAYVQLLAAAAGGEARAVLVEDGASALLVPLVVREVPGGGAWDAASPYGYAGPLAAGDDDAPAGAARTAAALLRDLGCVSLFLRLHPLLGPPVCPPGALVVQHGPTVVVDLHRTPEELWRATRAGHRSEIARSVRAGHLASVDDGWQHLDRFVELYRLTMTRVGATPDYFLDREHVLGLRAALGPSLHLAVVEIEGTVAAAGLFVETCGIVQYHLSGTDPAFLRDRPTKLLLHHVRAWARTRGNTVLHLGGGLGGAQDSLFAFKAGFSPLRASFTTVRAVLDEDRYRALTAEGDPAAPPDLSGFFPAYRRPPVRVPEPVASAAP